MQKYRVAIAGLGARGKSHLWGILNNPDRFEVVGLYNPGEANRNAVREQTGLNCFFDSPKEMMEAVQPDVLCFSTHPQIRMEYIDLGVQYGVKSISMEKPFALNMRDALEIHKKCAENGIKAVVSTQHKYYLQYQMLKQAVERREFGRITRVVAETTPWMHILGTHLVDYILWITGQKCADWVAGHVSGTDKLRDNHTSPDFMMGLIHFPNGLYANLECGYLSEPHLDQKEFWVDNRLTVYGEDGYAWADTLSRYGICSLETGGRLKTVEYPNIGVQDSAAETAYYADLYRWLENDQAIHPSNLDRALAGYEILTAICLSGLDKRRVDLPMGAEAYDVIERMKRELPQQAVPEALKKKGFFDHWGS